MRVLLIANSHARRGAEPIEPALEVFERAGIEVVQDAVAHGREAPDAIRRHAGQVDAVVLGGAMNFGGQESELGRNFLQRIRDEVRPRLLEPLRDKLKIEFASLAGDAGYIGAAGLARLEHSKGL